MRLALVIASLVLCAVACGDDSGGSATPTRNLHPDNPAFDYLVARPLNLPIASAADCPVTEAQLLDPTQPFVLGDGPVYPTGLGSTATLRVTELPEGTDWPGNYVTWLAQPEFSGKVLVRGGRIDGEGALGFDYAPVVPREPTGDKLQLDTETTSPGPDGYWQWPTYVRMRDPGCYAFQVDTDDGTEVIVFQATEDS